MATFELAPPMLRMVERYRPDLLVVELYQGQRPFSGLLEQVDWRLSGVISREVALARVTGRLGEQVLLPPGRHIRCGQVLVASLGPRAGVSSLICNRVIGEIARACDGLGTRCVALPLPGRAAGRFAAGVAAQLLANQFREREMRIVVIEEEQLHQEVAAALPGP
jgi:hypothetical protein